MSTIRRALIALVLVGLVVDGALIAYAKGIFSKAPEPKKFDLLIKVEKRDQATKLKKALEDAGLGEVPIQREKGEKRVLKGYKLVLESDDPTSLEPLAKTLKLQKHKFEYKPGDKILTYGATYPKKAQAEKAAAKLLSSDGIQFLVRENYKTQIMSYERLDLKGLSEDQKSSAREILDPAGVEVIETEVTSGTGQASEKEVAPSPDEASEPTP